MRKTAFLISVYLKLDIFTHALKLGLTSFFNTSTYIYNIIFALSPNNVFFHF